ncbi:hypothetical protein [Pedobacter boryungensis]|uniref:EamA-like transporter family protein n=1 Tax=Pedobacter boryungensis TaxID=869962 RepID=A0ABX2DG08_9SPHI|nr:hypothetical protein [Pedobacter boryungensis]NQX32707.1 hypothetical protein [Pedobacter boryungensis]
MNTKIIMSLSAIVMAIVGLTCSFMPDEILTYFSLPNAVGLSLIIQILGAIYLGFAFLNWMAKSNLIGGIYSKPIAIGNFMHYMMASLTMLKFFMAHPDLKLILIPLIIYAIFAFVFGKITFGSPI